jgi:UDP-N-acetylmuramoyl-L-alanyl-D-glutamate--2,6-diaminopimelate ligase
MLSKIKKIIPERHPLRLLYHKIKGVIAAVVNGFPGHKMIVVGVTGTNGKTTTVNMITNILNSAGYKVGMTSTINFQIGQKKWNNINKQTTLGPFKLQKLLKQMVKEGCTHAVIEVTSHALDQSRVFGINFDIAVITNVTPDHVEYHGDFNSYMSAKGELFRKVSKGKRKADVPKITILNADDKYFSFFNQFIADRKITYGIKQATVYASKIEKGPKGSRYSLHVPNNAVDVKLKMPGDFNVLNSLAAAATCMALQVPIHEIAKGLAERHNIAGRFEHIDCGQKFDVIVDYAHATDALESLLSLYRNLTPGNLFVVFGATGGGRDKAKRPQMGKVAHNYADYIILTNDDPYEEDEWEIIDQISQGIPREEGKNFWQIPDRKEAIRLALTMATEGDTVVVAGKGAEEIMMVRGKKIEWNDRKVIEDLLKREIKLHL